MVPVSTAFPTSRCVPNLNLNLNLICVQKQIKQKNLRTVKFKKETCSFSMGRAQFLNFESKYEGDEVKRLCELLKFNAKINFRVDHPSKSIGHSAKSFWLWHLFLITPLFYCFTLWISFTFSSCKNVKNWFFSQSISTEFNKLLFLCTKCANLSFIKCGNSD